MWVSVLPGSLAPASAARMAVMAGERGIDWLVDVWRMSSEKEVRKRIMVAVG